MQITLKNGRDVGGRPVIPEEEKKIKRIPLQVTEEEKEIIKEKAYNMGMNTNQFIRYLIRKAFQELQL